ncbi:cellulose binding domain-containing protein [Catenuloplanes sp. NPDC051500]|uniref:cellulose binding domain-containing protein n=1 Tax=Catenuloplanes sp. NPDC051500 TaxID=3363959 RepID=UPI0037AAE509
MPVLATAGILAGVLVAALLLVPGDAPQDASAASPPRSSAPDPTFDTLSDSPELSRVPGMGNPSPSAMGETSLVSGEGETESTDRSDATGTYRVLNSYGDSFIGEVLVHNPTTGVRHWSLQIAFDDTVGELYTFWVESAPQATMSRNGPVYTFISTVPLSAGASVSLRLQFARTGEDAPPRLCTVNGGTCRYR